MNWDSIRAVWSSVVEYLPSVSTVLGSVPVLQGKDQSKSKGQGQRARAKGSKDAKVKATKPLRLCDSTRELCVCVMSLCVCV